MSSVKSKELYSPQNFIEELTGYVYVFRSDDDIEEIHKLLRKTGVEAGGTPLRDYPLDEIDTVVENNVPVVLVETQRWDKKTKQYIRELRWFEVPDGFGNRLT